MVTKKKKYSIFILISIFLIFTILYTFNRDEKLKQNGIYTIALVKSVEGARGGMMVNIEYSYKGQKITNSFIESTGRETRKFVGKRFLILIRSDKPDTNFDFSFDRPMPDSIKEVPLNGWKTSPF